MKKLLSIICFVLVLTGCVEEIFSSRPGCVEDGKVQVKFKVNVPVQPEATRSFAEEGITDLYLIVFDNNGYLAEKCEASPVGSWTTSTTAETEFSVTLTASASKRVIHFIANYNGADQLAFGSESDVIGGMTHSDGADAYWQRMEFDGGINENTLSGVTVPLIRNHCKISVTESLDDFEITSFTLVNVVNEGYVSPYNKNTGTFADFIELNEDGSFMLTDGKYVCRPYADITNGTAAYEGYVPGTAELNLDTAVPDETLWTSYGSSYYMYERSFETEDHTFMLIKGKYTGGNDGTAAAETYYKVDLVGTDATTGLTFYYHLLRNFSYVINITDVTAHGKSKAQEACDMTGSHNNLAASIETQSLTNISNGEQQLYVSYTSEYIVSSDPITLYYKYIPNIDYPSVTGNASATYVKSDGDIFRAIVVSETDETSGEYEGWRCMTIYPNAPEDGNLKQEITIVAGELTRKVTYILRKPFKMSVTNTDPVATEINTSVVVNVTIPANLPEAIFPLSFYLEARERTLHPDASLNQLPVEVIPESLYEDVEETFGYVKTLTLDEYNSLTASDGLKSFVMYFRTNTELSASGIYVYNKYFDVAISNMGNYLSGVAIDGTQYYGTGNTVNMTFVAPTAGTYTFASSQLNLSTTTVTATAGQEIMITGTTTAWYGTIEVTVTTPSGTEVVTGRNRNIIKVGAMSAGANAPADTELVRVYDADGIILGSALWSEYKAGTVEIKLSGLTDQNTQVGQFAYTIDGETWASDSQSATQIISGTTINFNKVG